MIYRDFTDLPERLQFAAGCAFEHKPMAVLAYCEGNDSIPVKRKNHSRALNLAGVRQHHQTAGTVRLWQFSVENPCADDAAIFGE
jgi:hypothetical protein